jgi:hypothetical protein
MVVQPRRARWARFETRWLTVERTFPRSPIYLASGSTAFTLVVRPEALCSTWIRALVRRTANKK